MKENSPVVSYSAGAFQSSCLHGSSRVVTPLAEAEYLQRKRQTCWEHLLGCGKNDTTGLAQLKLEVLNSLAFLKLNRAVELRYDQNVAEEHQLTSAELKTLTISEFTSAWEHGQRGQTDHPTAWSSRTKAQRREKEGERGTEKKKGERYTEDLRESNDTLHPGLADQQGADYASHQASPMRTSSGSLLGDGAPINEGKAAGPQGCILTLRPMCNHRRERRLQGGGEAVLLWLWPYSGATYCKTCLDKDKNVGRYAETGGMAG
ncbi:hypothetical protein Q8A73_017504 [Channa argus]|nr:hypothetical protein Q8A73_017504 [Channa argus]